MSNSNRIIEEGLEELSEYGEDLDCTLNIHTNESLNFLFRTFAEKLWREAENRAYNQEGRNEVIEEVIEEIESFKIPENVEILPESQRIRKEWQNLVVELIVKRIKGLEK